MRVFRHRRELLVDGQPAKLGGRAFDVLLTLADAEGAVVTTDALMELVWPGRVVEENAVQAQISKLRGALGRHRGLVRNVPGRGYQLLAEEPLLAEPYPAEQAAGQSNLPQPASELIGREAEIEEVLELAGRHRLVTLTGPGGIGKTRLALAAGHRLLPQFADGVWFVELASVETLDLIPEAVASAVGMAALPGGMTAERLGRALRQKGMLIILDNCEHVIDGAATTAESLLRIGPEVHVLATSREPLRAEAEQVCRVSALPVPEAGTQDVVKASQYGAVRLFLERVWAAGQRFEPDGKLMAAIVSICRHLDGIPLAIELAAASAATLTVEQVAAHLDDRFKLLQAGRRTVPRHQTLRATLDWSYELLTEPERILLRRLAVFADVFDLEAVVGIATRGDLSRVEIVATLAGLVSKSLVATIEDRSVRYRLLETTRAYALDKLVQSAEHEIVSRLHADHYLRLFEQAEHDWRVGAVVEWSRDYGGFIDDLRGALTWGFSADGEASMAVRLTAASSPLWFELSRLSEYREWTRRALDRLEADDRGTRLEMVLQVNLGLAAMLTLGMDEGARAALRAGQALSVVLRDPEYELRALAALVNFSHRLEELEQAFALGRRAQTVASAMGDSMAHLAADGMLAPSLLLAADYGATLEFAERVERLVTPALRSNQISRFAIDRFRGYTAPALWITGLPVQAQQWVDKLFKDEIVSGHPMSRALILVWNACPIDMWCGSWASAASRIAELKEVSQTHLFTSYEACGLGYEGYLLAKEGKTEQAQALLRESLDRLREARYEVLYTMFLSKYAEVLAPLDPGRACDAASQAAERCERRRALWWLPEALRVRGEILLRLEPSDAAAAEHSFRRSLELARRQGALSWQLRTATSLARLKQRQGSFPKAKTLLQRVYCRFTEGFETADLRAAKATLDML
ncbi:MAG: winged helix-turn-helix domain-containing protein [Alphaproteobacteria bacterium]|nr:winged helix-turn-helix domain-containing protein [Alphaproteobacteria bacterium]